MAGYSVLDDYKILKTIAKGGSCVVKLAEEQKGAKFALKILNAEHEEYDMFKQDLDQEVLISQKLNTPQAIHVYKAKEGVYISKKNGAKKSRYYGILELAENGELHNFILKDRRLSEQAVRHYFKSLVKFMVYLASNNIAHRDIKPQNLLLDKDFNLKVSDFGFAKVVPKGALTKTDLGTPRYRAPEIVYEGEYDPMKADVFSTGITLFKMFFGVEPFRVSNARDPEYRLFVGKNEDFWVKYTKSRIVEDGLKTLITKMLCEDPNARPTIDEVNNSAWLNLPEDEEGVKMEMKEIKQFIEEARNCKPQDMKTNRGCSEDIDWESVMKHNVSGIPIKKISNETNAICAMNGVNIRMESREMLIGFTMEIIESFKGVRNEKEKGKLVYQFMDEDDYDSEEEMEQNGTTIDVKFFDLSDDLYHVQFLKLRGSYGDYQDIKSKLIKEILKGCESTE